MINLIGLSGDRDLRIKLDEHFNGYKVNIKSYKIAEITRLFMSGILKEVSDDEEVKEYLRNINRLKYCSEDEIDWEVDLKSAIEISSYDSKHLIFKRITRLNRKISRLVKRISEYDMEYPNRQHCLNGMLPVPIEERLHEESFKDWCRLNWGTDKDECFVKGRIGTNISMYRLACIHNLEPLAKNISLNNDDIEVTHYYCDGEKTIKKVFLDGNLIDEVINDDISSFVKYCKTLFPWREEIESRRVRNRNV